MVDLFQRRGVDFLDRFCLQAFHREGAGTVDERRRGSVQAGVMVETASGPANQLMFAFSQPPRSHRSRFHELGRLDDSVTCHGCMQAHLSMVTNRHIVIDNGTRVHNNVPSHYGARLDDRSGWNHGAFSTDAMEETDARGEMTVASSRP